MKTLFLLATLIVSGFALPIEEGERINGENGWYVPQLDGSFQWMYKEEVEPLLELESRNAERRADENDVSFFLLTNENPTEQEQIFPDVKSIKASSFNPNIPTRFTVHGWTNSAQEDWNFEVAEAWFSQGEYNMIAVDWKKARNLNYAGSVEHVSKAGKKIAAMITLLHKELGVSMDSVHCIGHSLGAHVCGYTGKNLKTKMHTIIGLDPALPLFDYNKPKLRLSTDDAMYVESIQTNGGKLGFLKPIGKIAFYPNGGKKQPGCVLDLTGSCSHGRAVSYYAAAITLNNFPSVKCNDYKEAVKKDCGATYSSIRMGAQSNFLLEGGEYFVPVTKTFPYGLA